MKEPSDYMLRTQISRMSKAIKSLVGIVHGRTFCFTGVSKKHSRQDFKEMVERNHGIFTNSVSAHVDYLIIGGGGNPCWAFACYGRKVESAVALRKSGNTIMLVHEEDFLDTVRDCE